MLGYKFRANIDIRQDTFSLLENKLYASKLSQLNDPFETTILDYFKEFSDSRIGSEALGKLLTRIKNEIGIYSLSIDKQGNRAVLEELMWAHYANSHKGFCIEYDVDVLKDSIKLDISDNVDLYTVTYDDVDMSEFALKRAKKEPKETLLSFKSPKWSYENEIRLIFDKSGIKQYNPKALKAIYFGLNMSSKERELIIKGLDGVDVKFYEMLKLKGQYKLESQLIAGNSVYLKDLLPNNLYSIIGTPEILRTVQNFNILYKGKDKSKNMISYFVSKFRNEHAYKPSNITIVDDVKALEFLDSKKTFNLNDQQKRFLADHWIAYSSFDAPDFVWMYPEK